MPVEIDAGRLCLRPWREQELPALVTAGSDPETVRWTPVPIPYDEAAARSLLERSAQGWADGSCTRFAVVDPAHGRERGQVRGEVQLGRIADGNAELGYWTTPSARGTGVTGEAVRAICRWGFLVLELRRIVALVEVGNSASLAVAQRAGFQYDGVRRAEIPRRDGSWADAWSASLLATDEVVDRRPFPGVEGRTDGVVTLRRWRPDDAGEVARACADPEIARWLPVPSPYTVTDGAYFAERIAPQAWADGSGAHLAVIDPGDGSLLGAVSLTRQPADCGEIGYWTAPWARGRAVAGRATRLLAEWATGVLGMRRLEALAEVDNAASQRAAARAGFTAEGVRRGAGVDPRSGARRDLSVWVRLAPDGS